MTTTSLAHTITLSFKNYQAYLRPCLIKLGYVTKPKFLIIGAQKCGTTSLAHYLKQHPNLARAIAKEINFFDQEISYCKGTGWYHEHFPLPYRMGSNDIAFEATPEYIYVPVAPARIYKYRPNIKLIALVRDPVERAFSSWNMFHNMLKRPDFDAVLADWRQRYDSVDGLLEAMQRWPSFEEAALAELAQLQAGQAPLMPGHIQRGLYAEQLARFFEYFPREQVLVIDSRRLSKEPLAVLNEICRFVGAPTYDWQQVDLARRNTGNYQARTISAEVESTLREFYTPYNQQLYTLLDHDFGWPQ